MSLSPGRLLRLGILIVLASAPPATGQAAEKLPLKPDKPGVWREATYFNTSTQFSCVDRQPRTARCAVELAMVCQVRQNDDELCARVWSVARRALAGEEEQLSDGSPNTRQRYRVEKVRFVTRTDINRYNAAPERYRPAVPVPHWTDLAVGDLVVTVRELSCGIGCPHIRYARRSGYRFRRIEGLWQWLWWPDHVLPPD
jgi:hypothetical protein